MPGIFRLFLVGTWYLHALPMGLLLAMLLLLAPLHLRAASARGEERRMLREIRRILPFAAGAAILVGTLPLVYLQILYAAYFYPAVITMAVPWLGGLLLLGTGTGFSFLLLFGSRRTSRWQGWAVLGMIPAFYGFAFLLVHMSLLAESPDLTAALYRQSASGLHLVVGRWELWARLMHVVTGAAALGMALIVGYGYLRWRRDGSGTYGEAVLRAGTFWFLLLGAAQAVTGPLFLLSQPSRVITGFLSGSALPYLLGGIALAFAGWLLLLLARLTGAWGLAPAGALLVLLSAAGMALNREILRVFHLGRPWFPPAAPHPQKMLIVLAGVGLILALSALLVGWTGRDWTRRQRREAGRYRGRRLVLRRG